MILRSLISFSLAAAMQAAVVSGSVKLRDSRDRNVQRGLDYSGVVVWLTHAAGGSVRSVKGGRATIVQKNKKFMPHVLAIRTGTVVDFPNYDPIFHNAFSNFSGQVFDIGLYKPGSSRSVAFNRAGIVRVFCNIHPLMSAVIVVVDSEWYATTDKDGSFRLKDVPPGSWRVNLFHERATPEELSKSEQVITVGSADLSLEPLTISEAGWLPTPHMNKHGRPYTAESDRYKVMR